MVGKRDLIMHELLAIIGDRAKLEIFIAANSNLPGPRGNLELAFAFAEVCEDFEIIRPWLDSSEEAAGHRPKDIVMFGRCERSGILSGFLRSRRLGETICTAEKRRIHSYFEKSFYRRQVEDERSGCVRFSIYR